MQDRGEVRFDGRIALVTGAGAGLGRDYALGLAARGARVVVNDLAVTASGQPAAEVVAAEIAAAGGQAMAAVADICDEGAVADMVARVARDWGPVDTLICNAGILRDKSFAKMEIAEFRKVVEVHLIGSAICAHAVWNDMRAAGYGRIVLTTSAAGIYGNFGQANYAAAKAGLIGLMHTLNIEGGAKGIRVNTIAPLAATAMTEGILPPELAQAMGPDAVAPAVLWLASEGAPTGVVMGASAGAYSVTHIRDSEGLFLPEDIRTPEEIARRFAEIEGAAGPLTALSGPEEQVNRYMALRKAAEG